MNFWRCKESPDSCCKDEERDDNEEEGVHVAREEFHSIESISEHTGWW